VSAPYPVSSATQRSALHRLLRPRSVAVVGASAAPGSLGASVLENLERCGFGGTVHLVNPRRREVAGRPCLASPDDLPEGVDCAVLAIPRAGVLEAAAACARRRVGSAIVFSAGFAESGEAGRADQADLARLARGAGMAVLGPNCLGMVNNVDGVALTFVAAPLARPAGRRGVAIVSQSGAMATVLGTSLAARELGVTFSVSTGNEVACGVEDFVEYVLDDDRTALVALIVEQFRDPARFLALALRARREGKHLVLLHPGASAAARASATTHTGAMAGDHEVMRTQVSHDGVVAVDTLEELCDVTDILVRCPALPRGGTAVMAESGAFKAMALDLGEALGLPLPPFGETTTAALRAALPDFIGPSNPLDLTAQGLVDPGLYRRTLPPVLADAGCGSVLLAIILTDLATSDRKLPPILDAIEEVRPAKPVLFAGLDEGALIDPSHVRRLRELGVPFFPSHERALRALARLSRHAGEQADLAQGGCDGAIASAAPAAALLDATGVVPEHRSKAVLAALGIPIPAGGLAGTVDEAQAVASRVGFPVALKAQSARLPHKSEAGGVVLGIADADELAAAWARLHEQIAARAPQILRQGPLEGVLVEHMAPPGVELIAGARVDPEWGPVLLLGLGGVFAEALRDVRVLSPEAPATAIEAALRGLRGARLLSGFRGAPPADVAAAAAVIRRLGDLVLATPAIVEVDLNPIVVHPLGQGATVLDALIVMRGELSGPSVASP
jgi:acyl-CoA synthetase (NDP forming)